MGQKRLYIPASRLARSAIPKTTFRADQTSQDDSTIYVFFVLLHSSSALKTTEDDSLFEW